MLRPTSRGALTVEVELTGGLANQLFQWASGLQLARENGAELRMLTYVVDRPDGRGEQLSPITPNVQLVRPSAFANWVWRVVDRTQSRLLRGGIKRISRPLHFRTYIARDFEAARSTLRTRGRVRLRGLFQDADRLYSYRREIRSLIGPRLAVHRSTLRPGPYGALHVRRGDYVAVPNYSKIFGACSPRYFLRGFEAMSEDLPVVIVSDDPDWCRGMVSDWPNLERIEVVSGTSHFDDLATLAGATELVMSNSTFSWWGALLGNPQRVYFPQPWFTDRTRDQCLVRGDWIGIERD